MQQLAKDLLDFRNTPPRSGVITSFDQLSTVPGVNANIINILKQECYLAPFSVRQVELVGPKVAGDLKQQAVQATLFALAGMLVYIWFRFEWIYGVAAVIAVFHDTIITIGIFSLFDKEITLTVIAALLTLVGYSMNDTIVIFDRIRENLKIYRREPLDSLINKSVNQTLSRTILTSGLTFMTVMALFLFGGTGTARILVRAGGWNSDRDVFFGFRRQPNCAILARFRGHAEEEGIPGCSRERAAAWIGWETGGCENGRKAAGQEGEVNLEMRKEHV